MNTRTEGVSIEKRETKMNTRTEGVSIEKRETFIHNKPLGSTQLRRRKSNKFQSQGVRT